LGKPRIILPAGPVRGEVFLFSDKQGWGTDEDALAASLQDKQVIVVGIDTKVLLGALNARPTNDCIYLVSDIEALSRRIQRAIGDSRYQSPIIAGMGTSGAFALAISECHHQADGGHRSDDGASLGQAALHGCATYLG
jgi:type IV secretory pathway VirJ component